MFQTIPLNAHHSLEGETSSPSVNAASDELVLTLDGIAFDEDSFVIYTASDLRRRFLSEGLNFLANLDGHFVITIAHNGVIHLIRDPLGQRSLFYSIDSQLGILLSDDIKTIRAKLELRDLNPHVLQSFKGIGFNLFSGETIYKNIHSVRPGHIATIEYGKETKTQSYKTRNYLHDTPTAHLIQRTLDNSINHCLSKTRTALFFSGGLDSSYLLIKALESGEITPFTMWDGTNSADLDDARVLSNEKSIPLSVELVSAPEIDNEIIDYAWHFAKPIGGGGFDLLGGVAFHILAKRIAAAGFKSAICGEGADELFLGYHQYHMDPQFLLAKLSTLIKQFNLEDFHARLAELNVYTETNRALRTIASTFGLSEYHLPSVNCSGIASQLSIQAPYMSFRLHSLVNSLPEQTLIDRCDNWTKVLLRQFFAKAMPKTNSRAGIRRKRSMTYSVLNLDKHIDSAVYNSGTRLSKEEIFWRLFFFLHVENSFLSPPDITLHDAIPLLEKLEVPL